MPLGLSHTYMQFFFLFFQDVHLNISKAFICTLINLHELSKHWVRLLFLCGFQIKSWLWPSLCLVSVEPGVWFSLEGAHCQVLFAGGLHIWLPCDGCHGWLVSCCLFWASTPLLSVYPKWSIHLNHKKTQNLIFSHWLETVRIVGISIVLRNFSWRFLRPTQNGGGEWSFFCA